MDTAQKKFANLKNKLSKLEYNQPLSFESMALVDKLLTDMLKTTEAFRKIKKQKDEMESRLGKESGY